MYDLSSSDTAPNIVSMNLPVIGTIEVLETVEAKEMIWQTGDEMFYKEGVSDPDYCVLKFTAHKGRYYSNFKSENFDI